MIVTFQEVISLLPVLFLCVTILFVLLFIILYRNHFITCFTTMLGLGLSFLSLYFVSCYGAQKITQLIYINSFSVLCMILILFSALSVSMISYTWLSRSLHIKNVDEFYLLLLIMTIGGIILVNSGHLVVLFFGIELIALPLSGLISYIYYQKYSLEATMKYVVLSGVSSSFLLFGIALLYSKTAHLSFIDLSYILHAMNNCDQSMILLIAISMILVALCFKLSLFPCHLWTPDVYQGSFEIATICLATISKVSIFAILTRFFLLFPSSYTTMHCVLFYISYISILFGNLMAIVQKSNIKRFLAYSSITHMGYLLICLVIAMKKMTSDINIIDFLSLSNFSIGVISVYLVSYFFATLGVFSVVNVVSNLHYDINRSNENCIFSMYRGLFWNYPVLSILFTVMLLSLSGMPITLGFIAKVCLIMSSVDQQLWGGIIIIVFGSSLGIVYYLRIITLLYLTPSSGSIVLLERKKFIKYVKSYDSHWIMTPSGIIVFLCSILLLFLGIFPKYLMHLFYLLHENFNFI